jgi:hypothetical protein
MGLYPINCPVCGKSFIWFSGNLPDQRCGECKGESVGRFVDPIKAMREHVSKLKFNISRWEKTATNSPDEYQRKLYSGLVQGARKEISDFECAIQYLEAGSTETETTA